MNVFELARAAGVAVVYADLGHWAGAQLRAEYDPSGPVIRINRRIVERLDARSARRFITFAIAHELYHHRERIGAVPRARARARREAAADEFARELVGGA